jgi:hypothetical protein
VEEEECHTPLDCTELRQLSSGLIEPFYLISMNLILALLTALAKGEE